MVKDEARVGFSQRSLREKRLQTIKREIKRYRSIYLLLIPGIVFFAVFAYSPLYGLQLAFKEYRLKFGIMGSPYIGLLNFETLLMRKEFWNAFSNTLELSFLKLLICFPVPIIIAMAFNELHSKRLMKGLQIIYTLPNFLSWVIVSGIMTKLMLSNGAINNLLKMVGAQPVDFLYDGGIFRGMLLVTDIWKSAGWSSIIYMAAITAIDPTLYESAIIDGANRWHRIWYITLPSIRPTIATLLILAVGGALNGNFDQIFNMYNNIVMSSTDIIDTYIYRITFLQTPDYGFSTALGLFKGVINCILLLTANIVVTKIDSDSKIL